MNLYEAQNQLINKIILCVDEDGVIDTDKLDEIEASYNDKVVACGFAIKRLQAQNAGRKAEVEAMTEPFKKAMERDTKSIERIKQRLLKSMQETNTQRCASADDTLKVVLYKDRDTSVNITDESALPEQYIVVKKQADKRALTSALKSGEVITGAELVKKDRLEIK